MMGDVTAPSASGSSATTTPSAVPIDASTEVPPQSRPFETVETISPKSQYVLSSHLLVIAIIDKSLQLAVFDCIYCHLNVPLFFLSIKV